MWPLIDILKLDPTPKSEKSACRAIPQSHELHEIVEQLIDMKNLSKRKFARIIGVNKNSVECWCGRLTHQEINPIPLWVLDKLVSGIESEISWRIKINSLISRVRIGRTGKIHKPPKFLTPQLAGIIGAHVADGSLSLISGRKTSLDWQLADGIKENVEMVRDWIKNTFNEFLTVKKFKKANAWFIRSRSQLIPKFLVNIADMPVGEKSNIVEEPSILKFPLRDKRLLTKPTKAQQGELELWFAKGVMNFDGHCTLTGKVPCIGIGSNSKKLLKDLKRIFEEKGVNFHNFEDHKKILTTSHDSAMKFAALNCFENSKKEKLLRFLATSTNYPES